jgi:hypothetical protein
MITDLLKPSDIEISAGKCKRFLTVLLKKGKVSGNPGVSQGSDKRIFTGKFLCNRSGSVNIQFL